MEPDKIFDDISNLPPEAQRQLFDLIIFLKKRYQLSKQETQKQNAGAKERRTTRRGYRFLPVSRPDRNRLVDIA